MYVLLSLPECECNFGHACLSARNSKTIALIVLIFVYIRRSIRCKPVYRSSFIKMIRVRTPEYIEWLFTKGLYRENAIAIESEAKSPFGGMVMCTTSQCKWRCPFRNFRVTNVICIVTYYTLPQIESLDSFWMTRSQRSIRRDKGLLRDRTTLWRQRAPWDQTCVMMKKS